ncbi:MAG TPA: AMIN domain-containing protein, partial [Casimicrobiaceae bacterium]
MWPAEEYTRVIFESKSPIEHQMVVLDDPPRVVLDLARIETSPELDALASRVQPSDPYVARVRVGHPSEGFLRVVLDLKTGVRPQVFSLPPVAEFGHRLVVDLYPLTPVDPLLALLRSEGVDTGGLVPDGATRGATTAQQPPASKGKTPRAVPVRRITVALDPGHGGEDPGAIGRRGTYEKDVVLAIGRRLAKVLTADAR